MQRRLVYPLLALAYTFVWGLLVWRYGQLTKPLGAAFRGPIYIGFGVCLLVRRLLVGKVMALWVLGNVAATWKRLTRRDVPQFLLGMRQFARHLAAHAPRKDNSAPH